MQTMARAMRRLDEILEKLCGIVKDEVEQDLDGLQDSLEEDLELKAKIKQHNIITTNTT